MTRSATTSIAASWSTRTINGTKTSTLCKATRSMTKTSRTTSRCSTTWWSPSTRLSPSRCASAYSNTSWARWSNGTSSVASSWTSMAVLVFRKDQLMSNKLSHSLRLKRNSLRRKLRCRPSPSAASGPAKWQLTWPRQVPKTTRPPSPMKFISSRRTLRSSSSSCDTPLEPMFTWASTTFPRLTLTPRWAHPFSSSRRIARLQSSTKDILINSTLKTWWSNRKNYCHTKRAQWASKSLSPALTRYFAQSVVSRLKTITNISSPANIRAESQENNTFSVRSTSLLARRSTTPKIPCWTLSPTWKTETTPLKTCPSPKLNKMAVNLKTKTGPFLTSLSPNRIRRKSRSTWTNPSPAQSVTALKPS